MTDTFSYSFGSGRVMGQFVRPRSGSSSASGYCNLIQPYQPVRTLRSSTSALLVMPFVISDFASDAFSVSPPSLWNNLHQDVRSCTNQATFKSRLKSHLFLSRLYRLVTPCVCAPILFKISGAI